MKKKTGGFRIRFVAILLLFLLMWMSFPFTAQAQDAEKTVRIGWHEAPYFITDQYGRRSGYSYEYQRKLVAYTGWKYEYVEGTWSELLQKLMDGEIDVMSNVSYTEERADKLLYASLPMGTEIYYVFTSPDNKQISEDDPSTLNGKRIGVTRNSIQKELFLNWEKMHDIHTELVEMSTTDEESLRMLGTKFDAFVSVDVYGDPETAVPVCKVGSSDFYFAVNKSRPDILADLDAAMNKIQDENKYYNQQLHERYLSSITADRFLNSAEKEWLTRHNSTIRVGYQDNYLAFCAADPATGELTGALKDLLAYGSTALEGTRLDFEAVAFPTAAAIEAMKNGKVDCVFPANLTDHDSETLGVVMTPPLMSTEMDAVVRANEQKEFIRKEQVTVAVNRGNTNYDMFLADHYPGWKRAYFEDTPTGLEAVAAGEADCVIISNYRFNNISKQCKKLHLTTVYTGVDMNYSFAVCEGDTELYSILAKVTDVVPDAVIHTALMYYSTEDVKISFGDLIKDNLFIVMTVIAAILLLILLLLLHGIRAEKKAQKEQLIVDDLNKRVFMDSLTSVKNKGAFDERMQDIKNQLDRGDPADFAIAIFDCDGLKTINDQYGHDKGDIYLRNASELICQTFQHSPVFRIGGDEFAAILQGEDYKERDILSDRFEALQKEIAAKAKNKWEEAHVSLGIAVYDPSSDRDVDDMLRRADKCMYEKKRIRKMSSGL